MVTISPCLHNSYNLSSNFQSVLDTKLESTFAFKVIEDHKVLDQVAGMITTWDEVMTLGIWLHCDPYDVQRLQSENNSIKGAAYKILGSFYSRSTSSDDKEEMLINALKVLGKEAVMSDFKLNF